MIRLLILVGMLLAATAGFASAQESVDQDYAPASGRARVIAQGVVEMPQGDAVWRTVRTRAPLIEDAEVAERPLGFVLATAGPLLLIDQDSAQQLRLAPGEAALTRAGAMVQVGSLAAQPVSYLSIELVPVTAPPPPASATVLQPGQPFAAPPGLHDLDLVSATLPAAESLVVSDSGAKNVVLITDGAANVGRPGSAAVVLLAGEAASFSGELEISVAPDGGDRQTSFVVAMIGPQLPPVAAPVSETTPTPPAVTEQGSITVQVFNCPAGMAAEALNPAVCAPATEDFDVTLSGVGLAAPLTIGDAAVSGESYTWSELPFGDYLIAEAVLPAGFNTYTLSARDAVGHPALGYRVTVDAAVPEQIVRIYNFAPG